MSFIQEKINGVTKVNFGDNDYHFQYFFPLATITVKTQASPADTDVITITYKDSTKQNERFTFGDITDPLSTTTAEGYVDELANQGFFFETTPVLIDYQVSRAIAEIYATYGDRVSVDQKNKSLRKFGENDNVSTSGSVIMTLPSGINEETMITTNGIVSVVSSSASDTQDIDFYEGHTISGGDLTFAIENTNNTLTGRTPVTLSTALARATRARLTSPAVGDIYFYEGGTVTNGVPDDGTKVHLIIPAGEIQTQKCSTSISSNDYWLIEQVTVGIIEKSSSWIEARVEIKEANDTYWYPITQWISASDNSGTVHLVTDGEPILVVPKNHDVRVYARASAANVATVAGIVGYLAKVI